MSFSRKKRQSVSVGTVVKEALLSPNTNLPFVMEATTSSLDFESWLRSKKQHIFTLLSQHGAVLFRGFGIGNMENFSRFAIALCEETYGDYSELPTSKASCYSATPYSRQHTIHFHNEGAHRHNWPLRQLFACLERATSGGQTPIADGRQLYSKMPENLRKHWQKNGLIYLRNFYDYDLSWQECYQVKNKSELEQFLQQHNIEFEWVNGGLRTYQSASIFYQHPKTKEPVFFSQIPIFAPLGLPPETRKSLQNDYSPLEFPRNVLHLDKTPVADDLLEETYHLYEEVSVQFDWQQGDVMLVDNMLVAHARKPYKGERLTGVALAEMVSRSEMEKWTLKL